MTQTRKTTNNSSDGCLRALALAAALAAWLVVAQWAAADNRAGAASFNDGLSRQEKIAMKVQALSDHSAELDDHAGRCISVAGMSILFDPQASDDDVYAALDLLPDEEFGTFLPQGSRWTTTAANGAVAQGERLTITYSFIPDGTSIQVSGNPTPEPSSLFANFDASFPGGRAAWKAKFAEAFNRWGELVNINYVEVADDGAVFSTSPGLLASAGTTGRGDVRIGMRSLGAPLAVNFFPQFGGDMVLDSQDVATFVSSTNNFRSLRNVLMHEHGHGMGLNHVLPTNSTKLMEPFLATAFDGPQEDDVRGAHFIYGDGFEQNDDLAANSFIGGPLRDPASNGVQTLSVADVSLERSDVSDFYGFTAFAGVPIAIRIDPVGTTYPFAPENNPSNTTTVDAKSVRNLGIRLWRRVSAANNTFQLVAQIDFNPGGEAEYHPPIPYSIAGYMVAEVYSNDGINDVQAYRMTISNSAIEAPVEPSNIRVFDGAVELGDSSTVRFDSTNVGDFANKTITIVNDGTGPLEIGAVTVQGPAANDYNFTLLANTVQPGQSTPLAVTFAPTSAGQRVAVISIPNNDPDRSDFSFIVSSPAVVQQAPAIAVSIDADAVNTNDTVDFGEIEIGQTATATIRIENMGNATLSLIAVNLEGDAAADYATTLASTTIPAGATLTREISVTPSATAARTAALTIAGNAQPTSFRINLVAVGVETVQIADCNANGIDDGVDIDVGTSADCNGNGIPDECEIDSDGDGVIDDCDRCPGLDDTLDADLDGTPDCNQDDPNQNENENNNANDNTNQNDNGNQNGNNNENNNDNTNQNNSNNNNNDGGDNANSLCGAGSGMPLMMSLLSICGGGWMRRRTRTTRRCRVR